VIGTLLALILLFQAPDFVPGAVSGHLNTVDGVPAVNTRVIALAVPNTTTGTADDALNYFELKAPVETTLTDNEGNFRLQELPPGRYYIMAGAAGDGRGTYYPNATHYRSAEVITVASGVIRENLNFALMSKLGGKLSGRVNTNITALGRRTATLIGGKLEELLEVPMRADGSFEFGHVPPGKYLLSLYPPTPGIASMPITVGDQDVSGLELVPLPTKKVSGRIAMKNGSIPHGILGFVTERTYVGGTISVDGTFSVDLHSARHEIDFAGLPVGYSLASVTVNGKDMTSGIVVGNSDLSDVLITVNAPSRLAVVKGKISGLTSNRFTTTFVQMEGPTFNRLIGDVQPDGTFEFGAVVPGLYRLTLNQFPERTPIIQPQMVVVDGFGTFEVTVTVPSP
jgi:hypothetical protein